MIQRVDKSYLELSEALLNLGCAIWKMFPNHAEDIKIVLPKFVHKELFGECKGIHKVVVQGPFGQYRVEADEAEAIIASLRCCGNCKHNFDADEEHCVGCCEPKLEKWEMR